MVGLNDVMITDPVAPFGGMKQVGPRTVRVLSAMTLRMEMPSQLYSTYIEFQRQLRIDEYPMNSCERTITNRGKLDDARDT